MSVFLRIISNFSESEWVNQPRSGIPSYAMDRVFRSDDFCAVILSSLPIKDVLRAEGVNRQFRKCAHTKCIWKKKSRELGIGPSIITEEKIDLRRTCIQTIKMREEIFDRALLAAEQIPDIFLFEPDPITKEEQAKAYSDIFKAQVKASDLTGAFKTANRFGNPLAQIQNLQLVTLQVQEGNMRRAFQAFKMIKAPKERNKALLELVKKQVESDDLPGAFKTTHRMSDPFQKAIAYLQIARAQAQTDTREAVDTLQRALQKAKKIKEPKEQSTVYLQIARAQDPIDPREAALTYERAHQAANQIRNPHRRTEACLEIAQAQDKPVADGTRQRAYETADRKIRQSSRIPPTPFELVSEYLKAGDIQGAQLSVLQIEDLSSQARACFLIVKAQVQAGDIPGALKTADQMGNPVLKADAYIEIAIAQDPIDTQEAARTYKKALETVNQIPSHIEKANIYIKVAQAQAKTDTRKAARTYKRALQIADQIDHSPFQVDTYIKIAKEQMQIDTREAAHTYKRARQIALYAQPAKDRVDACLAIAQQYIQMEN